MVLQVLKAIKFGAVQFRVLNDWVLKVFVLLAADEPRQHISSPKLPNGFPLNWLGCLNTETCLVNVLFLLQYVYSGFLFTRNSNGPLFIFY